MLFFMKFKNFTLALFLSMTSLCYAQDFTIEAPNVTADFNIQLTISEGAGLNATVTWANGLSETKIATGVSGANFQAPAGIVGSSATIKIDGDGKINIVGISDDSKISKFTVNADNTNLTELTLTNCGVSELDITKANKLTTLSVTQNNLTTVDLSGNSLLSGIGLNANYSLENITLPTGLSALTVLNLNNTKVGDAALQSILNIAPNIETLYVNKQTGVSDNKISSISLSGNLALKELWMQNNNLTGVIDLGLKPALERAILDNNNITSVVVNSATLSYMNLDNNKISMLNLEDAPNIKRLYCNNNQLTSLDFTGNTLIEQLELNNNNLTSITFDPAVTSLDVLKISGNLFDFATFPRFKITPSANYVYNNQRTLLEVATSGAGYNIVDMSRYDKPVAAGETVPGTAGLASTITWRHLSKPAEPLEKGTDFTVNTTTNVYTFDKAGIVDYFGSAKIYATVTNTAYSANTFSTIEIEIGKSSVGIDADEQNAVTCYYSTSADEIVYNVENAKRIYVYNLAGQVVLDQKLAADNGSINVSDLSKGVYVVMINGAKASVKQKFVKR